MRMLGDRVLVRLAPTRRLSDIGLELVEMLPPPPTVGRVVQVGPKVTSVAVGEVVGFSPESGDRVDDYFATPHLIVSEREIETVFEKGAM